MTTGAFTASNLIRELAILERQPARPRKCLCTLGEQHAEECPYSGVWVIVDLDGTLSDCSLRSYLAVQERWSEFNAASVNDVPFSNTVSLVKAFRRAGCKIAIATGRNDVWRADTRYWLAQHSVPYDQLFMRSSNSGNDWEIKPEWFNDDRVVLCVLEDRDAVVEAWRAAGYLCLQPRAGAF
jgi:hypothetical protein